MVSPIYTFYEIVMILKDKGGLTPTKLSILLNSDKRTIDKIINMGMKLNIFDVKEITPSGRKTVQISLTKPFYRMVLKNKI